MTGAEDTYLIYTVDPNGNYTSSKLIYGNDNIHQTEDFDIIPDEPVNGPYQDLYVINFDVNNSQNNRILRIAGESLVGHGGDILKPLKAL